MRAREILSLWGSRRLDLASHEGFRFGAQGAELTGVLANGLAIECARSPCLHVSAQFERAPFVSGTACGEKRKRAKRKLLKTHLPVLSAYYR